MKNLKKLLAVLLAVCMIAALFTVPAFAADDEDEDVLVITEDGYQITGKETKPIIIRAKNVTFAPGAKITVPVTIEVVDVITIPSGVTVASLTIAVPATVEVAGTVTGAVTVAETAATETAAATVTVAQTATVASVTVEAPVTVEVAGTVTGAVTVTETAATDAGSATVTVAETAKVEEIKVDAADTSLTVAGAVTTVSVGENADNVTVEVKETAAIDKVESSNSSTTMTGATENVASSSGVKDEGSKQEEEKQETEEIPEEDVVVTKAPKVVKARLSDAGKTYTTCDTGKAQKLADDLKLMAYVTMKTSYKGLLDGLGMDEKQLEDFLAAKTNIDYSNITELAYVELVADKDLAEHTNGGTSGTKAQWVGVAMKYENGWVYVVTQAKEGYSAGAFVDLNGTIDGEKTTALVFTPGADRILTADGLTLVTEWEAANNRAYDGDMYFSLYLEAEDSEGAWVTVVDKGGEIKLAENSALSEAAAAITETKGVELTSVEGTAIEIYKIESSVADGT